MSVTQSLSVCYDCAIPSKSSRVLVDIALAHITVRICDVFSRSLSYGHSGSMVILSVTHH